MPSLQRRKSILIFICIVAWMSLVMYATIKNPSAEKSGEKFKMMEKTSAELLRLGGKVVRSRRLSKYGGAYITLTFSDEGWGQALIGKYEGFLIKDGWIAVSKDMLSYCKDEIFLKIEPHSGVIENIGVNDISATYDAVSIANCKNAIPP